MCRGAREDAAIADSLHESRDVLEDGSLLLRRLVDLSDAGVHVTLATDFGAEVLIVSSRGTKLISEIVCTVLRLSSLAMRVATHRFRTEPCHLLCSAARGGARIGLESRSAARRHRLSHKLDVD